MQEIKLICHECQEPFTKARREYDRQIKAGRNRFFCRMSCWGICSNREKPRTNPPPQFSYHQKDEYIHFRWFLLRVKQRAKESARKNTDIDLKYLKELWESQNGTCPLTGWTMRLPVSSTSGFESTRPENASLDRINNDLGYLKNNVRFVALIVNLAKMKFHDEDVKEFCKAVVINCNLG